MCQRYINGNTMARDNLNGHIQVDAFQHYFTHKIVYYILLRADSVEDTLRAA